MKRFSMRLISIMVLMTVCLFFADAILCASSFDADFLKDSSSKVEKKDKEKEKKVASDEDDDVDAPEDTYCDKGTPSLTSTTPPFESGLNGYAAFRQPALVISGKGTVLAFCQGRLNGHQDEGDIDVVLRRSYDNGKTWEKMQIIADDGKNPCKVACPVVLDSGRILLLWAWNKSISSKKARNKLPHPARPVFLTYSDDDGKTWAKSRDISSMVYGKDWGWSGLGPCHGIVKRRDPHKGRIVVAARHNVKNSAKSGVSHVIYSDDEGKNWNIGGSALKSSSESTVVELSNGELMLNSRNQRSKSPYRLVSLSRDGGKTFYKSYEEKAHIEPRGCQGSLLFHSINKETGMGNIIFSGPRHPEWRANGCLQLSEDDGKTWKKRRRYSGKPLKFSGYSDIALINGNDIAVLFERGGIQVNEKGKSIKGERYDRIGFKIIPFSALKGEDKGK